MSARRVTITGATGLLGPRVFAALQERGAEVTVLTRAPERARSQLSGDLDAVRWDAIAEPAPEHALEGRDAVLHLAGEPVAQRWTGRARTAIRESRVRGTANLVTGIAACSERPAALVHASAIGYYGARGEEPIDEDVGPGQDFLAQVCVEWEAEAARAEELGLRTVAVRTGVVLDAHGGALAKMLPPFRLGVGGPVAGGRQYIAWIHEQDYVGLVLAALDGEAWIGPVNATAPEPVSNAAFSRELGRVLGRPAVLPVPGLALRALYGEMAEIITTGARVVPAKALVLGYEFSHPHLPEALRSALGSA
jgi:uncharacterized protein (TIGR01777 family)